MYIPVTRHDGRCRDFTGIHSEYRARYSYRIQFSNPDFENCRFPRTCAAVRLAIVPAYRYRRITRNPIISAGSLSVIYSKTIRGSHGSIFLCGRIAEFLTESKFSRNIRASFFLSFLSDGRIFNVPIGPINIA